MNRFDRSNTVVFFVVLWLVDTALLYAALPLFAGRTLSWEAASAVALPATAAIQWLTYKWIKRIT